MSTERSRTFTRAVAIAETAVVASTLFFPTIARAESLPEKASLPTQTQDAYSFDSFSKPPIKKDNLGEPNDLGYYYLPPSKDGSYIFRDPQCTPEHWGSKELVNFVKDMAHTWKEKHPKGYLKVEDLNGPYAEHKSHHRGIDVDLYATTDGNEWAGNMKKGKYSEKASIELVKMFADTGEVGLIFYSDPKVIKEVNKYKSRSENMEMQYLDDHDQHMHVRLDIPTLPYFAPEGRKEDCHPTPLK